jgi:sulfate adenylyltransferase subunit 1 (EFTu-like GTPase family)
MDLAGYEQAAFERIRQAFPGAHHIPVSALVGDNVVERSARMPWYAGPSLLELLEELPVGQSAEGPFRFPVQLVIRPDASFRGYAGQVAGGRIRVGDEVTALPSYRTARVARIATFDGDLPEAFAPMSVTVVLDREIDLSRGAMLASAPLPSASRRVSAQAVALQPEGIQAGRDYLLRHTTALVPARLLAGSLAMNGIGRVEIETAQPVHFDAYRENRQTGAFVLVDRYSNNTVAAGMIDTGVIRRSEPILLKVARGLRRAADAIEDFSQGGGI